VRHSAELLAVPPWGRPFHFFVDFFIGGDEIPLKHVGGTLNHHLTSVHSLGPDFHPGLFFSSV
jgi:hypothetical protein